MFFKFQPALEKRPVEKIWTRSRHSFFSVTQRCLTITFITIAITCLSFANAKAQFFKKLKKTVKELVVTPPVNGDSQSTGQERPNTKPGVHSDHVFLKQDPNQAILNNPAGHGIFQIAALSIDYIHQYLFRDLTSIDLNEDSNSLQMPVIATIPVGNFTDKEALSELGEGSDRDEVAIYTNDKVSQRLNAAVLKQQKDLAEKHKKYEYPWGEEIVRNAKKEANDYIKKGTGQGGMYSSIVFNGKSYGPYMIIGDFLISKDKSRFFAQISPDMDHAQKGQYCLLDMYGKTRNLPTGGDLIANYGFSMGAVMITSAAIRMNEALHISDEQKSAKKQAEGSLLMQTDPNKGNVYFLNGKTLENVLLSHGWLDQTGQNFFATVAEDNSGFEKGTYLNGKKIDTRSIKTGHGWATPDGASWAIQVDDILNGGVDQLLFSDGTHIYEARDAHPLLVQGKYYLVWYTYNHEYSNLLRVFKKLL
jgi:hypothetical protein